MATVQSAERGGGLGEAFSCLLKNTHIQEYRVNTILHTHLIRRRPPLKNHFLVAFLFGRTGNR